MTARPRSELDDLLAAWAAARRLPEADADRIRQVIAPAEAGLPATWWTEFNGRLSEVISRATAMPVPALPALP